MVRALITVAVLAGSASADRACDLPCRVEGVRSMLARGESIEARAELVKLYAEFAAPELLFALGQVELKLGNYEAAIGYYERFIATAPGADHVALAQQGIGAARAEMIRPPPPPEKPRDPPPPPPRFERRWDRAGTIIVATGGATAIAGGLLLYSSHQLGNDTGGTLAEYDARLERANARRFGGVLAGALGTLAIGYAIVRWRFDRTLVITPTPGGDGMAASVSARW
jgi:tetratricopeptide (TPR) repeat protein